MQKMNLIIPLSMAGLMGMGTYILMNRNTKVKADKLINNLLDKANDMTSNMKK